MSHPPSSAAPVTPERIYQLGWGFAATQALVTAIELDLFGAIAGGARDVHALEAKLGASERGVRMVVDAMAGFGLVTKGPGGLALAPDAAMFLVRSSPAFVGDFLVLHGRELADRWRGLTECVRTGRPVTALDRPEEGVPFWKKLVDGLFPVGFAAAQVAGKELARRHPTGELRLLDVAAGSGVWGFGAALAEPRVRVTTQDLPETLEHARAWAARTGVANRVAWLSGDLREVDFGTAAFDAAVLGHICHSEGAAHTQRLLAKVARALKPGGTIVIVEFVPDEGRASPPSPLLFALNMLVHTTEGDTFTASEYRTWLEAAGFRDVASLPAPSPSPLILATRR